MLRQETRHNTPQCTIDGTLRPSFQGERTCEPVKYSVGLLEAPGSDESRGVRTKNRQAPGRVRQAKMNMHFKSTRPQHRGVNHVKAVRRADNKHVLLHLATKHNWCQNKREGNREMGGAVPSPQKPKSPPLGRRF